MATQMHKIAVVLGLLGSFAKASQVEVVLAHYNEDLSWITRIPDDVDIQIYTKGSKVDLNVPSVPRASVQQLPNVGRETHTYLQHIVENFERLADWTVFTQAGEPSFGYKGHRSGGGHLLAGDDFANYLVPHPSGSRFVYTAVVHLPSMNHLLRASYCINDELLEGEGARICPNDASQWTPWWDIGEFRSFLSSMVESQHGDNIMDFYRKHINPAFSGNEVTAFFPQGARFAVSKETIQRRPKADYERLLASLSNNEDPYAGYFMEWLWSELFLGHQEPCPVPPMLTAVSHTEAMKSLVQSFPRSMQRQLSTARNLAGAADCVCTEGGISGSFSGAISGGISSGVSGTISGAISGGISGASCSCAGVSGGISMGVISFGGISGGISSATTVGGVLVVEIFVEISKEAVQDMFTRALANALEVPVQLVLWLTASEIDQSSGSQRRLQENVTNQTTFHTDQRKLYEVAFQIIVPDHLDADEILEKAKRIAEPGSAESQRFRQVLSMLLKRSTAVGNVASKVPPHKKVPEPTVPQSTPEEEDDRVWVAVLIGACAFILLVSCLLTTFILVRRRKASNGASKAPANTELDPDLL